MPKTSDEIVLVVDPGSSSIKVGYAGDDVPTCIFPSCLKKPGSRIESIEAIGDAARGDFPIQRGLIKDFDKMEALWDRIMEEMGLTTMENVSVMIAESMKSSPDQRNEWANMLFRFNAPSICIGNSASLTIFASGRTTGLAVECGAGLTTSVPVFEGLALSHASLAMDFAGQDITSALQRNLLEEIGFRENFDSFEVKSLKERMAFVSPYLPGEGQLSREEIITFSLPDGTEVAVGNSSFYDCCEKLFHNEQLQPIGGLVNHVHESLFLCDESIRRDLMNNVVIAGGTSLLPGFGDRIARELVVKSLSAADRFSVGSHVVRVLPSSSLREPGYTLQRKIAPWIGASIIGSLDTYSELKVTRQEYEEANGLSTWQTKCF